MKPPFAYYGGKQKYTKTILAYFQPHHTYVDLFGGSGAVLLAKDPAPVEVFNDIFDGVVVFYEVLRDRRLSGELVRRLRLTPYSRKEYYNCLNTWRACRDPVEKARRWYLVQVNSFNGRFGAGLMHSSTATSRGKAAHVSSFHSSIARLADVSERFRDVVIENCDFRVAIKRYDTPNTLFYADPPYIMDTRNASSTYTHEACVQDHTDLVNLALGSRGDWVISGYAHEIYSPLEEAGWQRVEFSAIASSAAYNAKRDRRRVEALWISPAAPNGGRSGHILDTIA